MGYAFINIIEKEDILMFFNAFNNKKWELFKSKKVINIILDLRDQIRKNPRKIRAGKTF